MTSYTQVALVTAPFLTPDSIPIGLLMMAAKLDAAGVSNLTLNLDAAFADRVGREAYDWVRYSDPVELIGDMVFASTDWEESHQLLLNERFETTHPSWSPFQTNISSQNEKNHIALLRNNIDSFIEESASELTELSPRVIGFSFFSNQRSASLALARLCKQRNPNVLTVLGGPSCQGGVGTSLLQAFPFIDVVVEADAENAFPAIIASHLSSGRLTVTNGVVFRVESVTSSNSLTPSEGSQTRNRLVQSVANRSARTSHSFRQVAASLDTKLIDPKAVSSEISLARKCPQSSVILVSGSDLRGEHLAPLTPEERTGAYKRIIHEASASSDASVLRKLRDAGVSSVMVDIGALEKESNELLIPDPDDLTKVLFLRTCLELEIDVRWSLFYGMPTQTNASLSSTANRAKLLSHLPSPSSFLPFRFFRNSAPYGFEKNVDMRNHAVPVRGYGRAFPGLESSTKSFASFFEYSMPLELTEAARAIVPLINDWHSNWPNSALFYVKSERQSIIFDTRKTAVAPFILASPDHMDVIQEITTPRTISPLSAQYTIASELELLGLAIRSDDRFLSLICDVADFAPTPRHKVKIAALLGIAPPFYEELVNLPASALRVLGSEPKLPLALRFRSIPEDGIVIELVN